MSSKEDDVNAHSFSKRRRQDDNNHSPKSTQEKTESLKAQLKTPAAGSSSTTIATKAKKPSLITADEFFPDLNDLDADGAPLAPRGFKVDQSLPRTRQKTLLHHDAAIKFAEIEVPEESILAYGTSISNEVVPKTVDEAKKLPTWPSWKAAIKSEYDSMREREVFSEVIDLPKGKRLIGNRLVLTIKTEPTKRYKARLVAKGFNQRYGIDYHATYSPVLDIATYRLLIGISSIMSWQIHALDVQTAFLYGDLEEDVYMKVPEGAHVPSHIQRPCVKLLKSFRVSSVFFKNTPDGPIITSIYVDDTNLMGPEKAIMSTKTMLKSHFQMKDFGEVSACIGIEIDHLPTGVFVHQSKMVQKIISMMNLEHTSTQKIPLEVRSVQLGKDIYGARREGEAPYPYMTTYRSCIGMLSYLANSTRPDISFSVNLLARFSKNPTYRHYKGLKHICQYLKHTPDHGLFFKKAQDFKIEVYADAGYRSDSTTSKSQTGYVLMLNDTAFHWRSVKQTITATSAFEAELISLYEATREISWLANFLTTLQTTLDVTILKTPIPVFEDNEAAFRTIKEGYIRTNANKHVDPKYWRTRDMVLAKQIEIKSVSGNQNPADILTKTLPANKHKQCTEQLGIWSRASLLSFG
ncbi:DNA-directed DNA polymerase [Synchytrium microbalum]|uniref:DNA-directed DNA polymerase n=1 Tax=Synchytrium microbalum TaxID=1806994 RepID=A0A507CG80_9FUNG|nr:DNA-directed DNA polymerase [Synchytrium microbalum]TPX36954.1 DNA-directed DNA polymerase [Synchytrium microbalum]